MNTTIFLSLIALFPIVVVLSTMIAWRWSGTKAGAAGWAVAIILALAFFGAPLELLFYAHLRSLLLSLYVLYIVWMALLLYHVVKEAQAIEDISAGVAHLTSDKLIQLLILAWIFASFLQGITGFGVPVAVVTPLLVGLGFEPLLSVVATGIAHSWAVTFGSAASSFYTMVAVTGQAGTLLAPDSALLLGAGSWLCALCVAHLYGGWLAIRRSLLFIFVVGLAMAGTQYLLAIAGFWAIAAFAAGLAGMMVAIPLARLPIYRGRAKQADDDSLRLRLPISISAYILLLMIVFAAGSIPFLDDWLNRLELNYTFPPVSTTLGWQVAGGSGRSVSIFGHAGALIGYTSYLSFLIYRRAGRYQAYTGWQIIRQTINKSVQSSLSILTLVAMALVMDNSGMVFAIADGLQRILPATLYPLAAPLIGALGAFMTGSNTNSNVIFAPLQKQVAELLMLSTPAILAAQTTGGALGSMIAPAKIIVGASTANIAGREAEVLRMTAPYALLLLLVTGGLTYLLL